MKRLLLFLALFGSALGLVFWLERSTASTTDRPDGAAGGNRALPEGGTPRGIQPGGALFVRGFEETDSGDQPVRFELSAEESAVVGTDLWELRTVVLNLFDPSDGLLMARLEAESGRARVLETGPHFQPRFDRSSLVLEVVTVDVQRGSPILPITMKAPTIAVDLDARTFTSGAGATFEAPELSAAGEGLFVDLDDGTLVFEHGGTLEIGARGRPGAIFRSEGPMRFQRTPATGSTLAPVTIEGTGGAEIDLVDADEDTHVEAETIVLVGADSEEGEPFSLRSARMEENVVWRSGASVFRGASGQARFGAFDQLTSARMEGLPSARLGLPADASLDELEAATIVVEGAGPLEITTTDGLSFEMGGPATVETQGSDLRSNGSISGRVNEAAGVANFLARGGVVLDSEVGSLETAELDVEIRTVRADERELRAISRGGARLEGQMTDGTKFTLTSPDRIEVRRLGDQWHVVEALSVTLAVEGEEGFRARAGRVIDFDVDRFSFRAEDDIAFEGKLGQASGDRARVVGRDHYVLEGTDERPATFDGLGRYAEARFVEVDGNHLMARGAVKAKVLPKDESEDTFELQCEALDIEQREVVDAANGLPRRDITVQAAGEVNASILSASEHTQLYCDELEITRFAWYPADDPAQEPLRSVSKLVASGHVDGSLARPDAELGVRCDELTVDRAEHADGRSSYLATASGSVDFEGATNLPFRGHGERLVLDEKNDGVLSTVPGGRVDVGGRLPSSGTPFTLTADEIRFKGRAIEADEPEISVAPTAVSSDDEIPVRATAHTLRADETALELIGDVRVDGQTQQGDLWTLAADRVAFQGELGQELEEASLSGLLASGGIDFQLGTQARARGDELVARALFGTMRLTGSPVLIESDAFNIEAEWIEFDPELQIVVGTGAGRIFPAPKNPLALAERELWTLEYLSSQTLVEPDSLVYVLQEPIVNYPNENATLRASWALLWLDRRAWANLPDRFADEEAQEVEDLRVTTEEEFAQSSAGPPRRLLFKQIEDSLLAGLLREAYFEGPVQLVQDGDLVARSDALYLDVVTGHGWMADVTVNLFGRMLQEDFEKLVVKADWLHHTADGLLQADSATVTTCDHDEPHIRIVTGDLKIRPTEDDEGEAVYEVGLRDNRVELYDLITIPLPPFKFGTDEDYAPLWRTMAFGNSARFGTLVSAGISGPAEGIGKTVNKALGRGSSDYRASYSIQAAYLGSRGALIDLGLKTESKDNYWFDMVLGAVPDTGDDRGFIRVEDEDRDAVRLWYRAQGRYNFDETQWIDTSISLQNDAGVQSEFWESDFLLYEQAETFLRWRRARGSSFYDASLKVHPQDFRSDISELPSVGAYSGRTPIAEIGSVRIIHTGDARVEYLQRRAGDPRYESPFSSSPPLDPNGGFADGFGDREVLRFDTTQTLEAPVSIGPGALRATPFADVRLTAWDDDTTSTQSPTRVRAEAGLRLATTFWRSTSNGDAQSFSPFVQFRGEVAFEEDGGSPVPFDSTESAIDGSFFDIGVRGRFPLESMKARLDLEVRGSYASSGSDTGWRPVSIFSRLDLEPWGQPAHFWYDARFETDEQATLFSLIGVATRIDERLLIEASHHFGRRSDTLDTTYEAVSVAGAYRWTEKWEFEGRQTVSLFENTGLGTKFILRRYGHDVILELETSVRSGEGGGSVGIKIQPRFGWRPPNIGYLNY